MLSKSDIRFVQSLSLKKNRDQHLLFVAEGEKLVHDLHRTLKAHLLYATKSAPHLGATTISEDEMKKMSALKNPSAFLGVFEQPQHSLPVDFAANWTLVLDDVQDPGNLGTIIRLCDWFGIDTLLCSPHTADCYNPKVVQASMGAIARVKICYLPLVPFLRQLKNVPIWGTFLEGENIYQTRFPSGGIVVLGNEGNGISPEVARCVSKKIYIPPFARAPYSESLNVATAAAVLCSELKRSTPCPL